MKLRPIALLVLGAATAALAIAPAQAHAPKTPRAVSMTFFHTLEGGRHYNLYASVKGEAVKVRAFLGDTEAAGKNTGEANGIPSWFFRDRGFVRFVRAELEFDGMSELAVRAVGEPDHTVRICTLVVQDNPVGLFAEGDCRKPPS